MQTHLNQPDKLDKHAAADRSTPKVIQQHTTAKAPSSPQDNLHQLIQNSTRVQQFKTQQETIQRQAKSNGLPEQLKSGIEGLSGIAMDDVKVHYNSSQPAQLNAHAYAQGSNIHLGPGQEKHLPHEAWHVVQQKQGRVRPTMQMKGKVNINDDGGLEREADRMGRQALTGGTANSTAKPLQLKFWNAAVIQRKTANLPNTVFVNNLGLALGGGDFSTLYTSVTNYNAILMAATNYVEQERDLKNISEIEDDGFNYLARDFLVKYNNLDDEVNDLQQQKTRVKRQLQAYKGRSILSTIEEREKQKLEQEKGRIGIQIAVKENQKQEATRKRLAVPGIQGQFNIALQQEEAAVQNQMLTDSDNAIIPTIDTSRGGYFRNIAPNAINRQIVKLQNAPTYPEKLPIVLELDKQIYNWKQKHLLPNGQLKPTYRNQTDNNEGKLRSILLIEHQLQFTRNHILHQVFNGGGGVQMPGVEGSKKGLLALGKGTAGMLATGMRGTRFEGGAGSSEGVSNALVKEGGLYLEGKFGIKMSPKEVSKLSEELNAAGAGVNALGQIFRLVEVYDSWKNIKTKKDVLNSILETLGLATTTAAEVTMVGDNVEKAKDGKLIDPNSSPKWDDMTDWAKSAVVTKGLAQGIFALKNAALGLISLYEAYKRIGVDKEAMLSKTLYGGVSLTKAVIASMRTAQTVYNIIHKAVPPGLLHAIPFVAIALDIIEAIEAAYRWYIGRKYQNQIEEELRQFHNRSTIGGLLANVNLARDEKRGIMGTRQTVRRFHPYVLSKIDSHNNSNNLFIKEGVTVNQSGQYSRFTPAQIKEVREYEYLSKMQEINQKRKVSGGIDAFIALTNMTGDILTLTHFGIIPGVALKTLTTGSSLTHKGAVLGQRYFRNKERKNMGLDHRGVAGLDSVEEYNQRIGGREVIDKSSIQKQTEYYRHATYILDRLANLQNLGHNPNNISAMVKEYQTTKFMIKSTGVDYYSFLEANNITDQIKLLMSAMKGGR